MISRFYHRPFPVLPLNDEFVLREHRPSDTDDFYEYYTDPDVARYILANNPRSKAEAAREVSYCHRLFQQKRGIYWAIARKSDDKMVGAVGLYMNNQHHRAEICYDLSKHFWRNGLMSASIKAICQFAFKHIGINRMEALTVPENVGSIKLLEKVGFEYEAMLRNYRYFNNKSHDVLMYGITPKMFAAIIAAEKANTAETA